jgi:hypothetical protein
MICRGVSVLWMHLLGKQKILKDLHRLLERLRCERLLREPSLCERLESVGIAPTLGAALARNPSER